MTRYRAIFAALAILSAVQAWGNAGTALIWAQMAHLVVANLALGIAEGLLIAAAFHCNPWKSMALMIAANYASYATGALWTVGVAEHLPITLDNAAATVWALFAAYYLVTVVVEYPFIAYLLLNKRRVWLKAIVASVVVQALSYAILVGMYERAVRDDFIDAGAVVPLETMPIPDDVVVYYVDARDGELYRQRLGELSRSEPGELELEAIGDRIEAAQDAFDFGEVPRIGEPSESGWQFSTDYWGYLFGRKGGESQAWAVETPFFTWHVRHAAQLSNDTVLFQLGENMICLFDPETENTALFARGRRPIVTVEASVR